MNRLSTMIDPSPIESILPCKGTIDFSGLLLQMTPCRLSRDPATRLFGLFLLASLTLSTLGVIAGIAAGNISHYSTKVFDRAIKRIDFF